MKRTVTALALAVLAATTGCAGDDSDDGSAAAQAADAPATVLKISDTSKPGAWDFDTHRLTANAGKVTIEFHNDSGLGHNVRVHTGKCCFNPGYKDVGGTDVI